MLVYFPKKLKNGDSVYVLQEFVAVRVQDPRIQNEGSWNSYVDYKIFLHVSVNDHIITFVADFQAKKKKTLNHSGFNVSIFCCTVL